MAQTTPGWFPAPSNASLLEYWDGEMWTGRMRPVPGTEAVEPAPLNLRPEAGVLSSRSVQAELEDGEEVLAGFSGSNGFRKRMVVATDRRVLWLERKGLRGRFAVTTLRYEAIDDIVASRASRYAPDLTITAGQKTYKVFAIPVETLFDFAKFVRLRTSERPTSTQQPPPMAAGETAATDPAEDLVAGIERLTALHEQGALTEAEFADAKAILLRPSQPNS